MYEFNKISKDDLITIFRNTARKMNVQETIVEKDYWVCFVLNYLFSTCIWKESFTFKGGTSLSKCFSLIHRFSEDIDLILDWRVIGYAKDEPWELRSKTQQDKFNKESNQKVTVFLEEQFIGQMMIDFNNFLDDEFCIRIDDKDPQAVLFEYPKVFRSEYLLQAVRLEIGALAAWTPSETATVLPYVAEQYPQVFQGSKIEIKTVSPERTFWEKATILHHEANRPDSLDIPKRYARHYYDLYCIGNSKYKDYIFSNIDQLVKVVSFKEKFYSRKWANYESATKEKIRLLPDKYRFKELKEDYENMKEMFFDEYPNFEDLMAGIAKLEDEIHDI